MIGSGGNVKVHQWEQNTENMLRRWSPTYRVWGLLCPNTAYLVCVLKSWKAVGKNSWEIGAALCSIAILGSRCTPIRYHICISFSNILSPSCIHNWVSIPFNQATIGNHYFSGTIELTRQLNSPPKKCQLFDTIVKIFSLAPNCRFVHVLVITPNV